MFLLENCCLYYFTKLPHPTPTTASFHSNNNVNVDSSLDRQLNHASPCLWKAHQWCYPTQIIAIDFIVFQINSDGKLLVVDYIMGRVKSHISTMNGLNNGCEGYLFSSLHPFLRLMPFKYQIERRLDVPQILKWWKCCCVLLKLTTRMHPFLFSKSAMNSASEYVFSPHQSTLHGWSESKCTWALGTTISHQLAPSPSSGGVRHTAYPLLRKKQLTSSTYADEGKSVHLLLGNSYNCSIW